jgi:hypothetical protein
MKNTILNYDREEVEMDLDGNINDVVASVPDYFSKDINVFEIFDDVSDMLDVYQCDDDDKIERISYELYGTTDYWDLLLLLNDKNPLSQLPYNESVLQQSTEAHINLYKNYIYSHAPLLQTRTNELLAEFLQQDKENNEKFRFLYIIKPTKINDFIKIVNESGYL